VQGDTWVYDLAADQWHEVTPPRSPPRGEPVLDMVRLPMIFHPPSGKLLLHTTPLDAANLEYFTLSRLATVVWLSALTGSLGVSADWAMRATMWLGFAGVAGASFFLARRWTNAPAIVVVGALLLIPGLAENAFFYNDTIFAAALGTAALAVLSISPGFVATACSGVLFGCAIAARLDAVLLGTAVALIGYKQHGLRRGFWLYAGVFALGAAVPIVAIPGLLHATIFDVVATTRYAVTLWGHHPKLTLHAREIFLFLGIPGFVLAAFGCIGLIRARNYYSAALLLGVPVLFNLVGLGRIWQSRQLLPLTPFLAALAILGWQHVMLETRPRNSRIVFAFSMAFVCALAWIAPIFAVIDSDGPRAPYGRLWTPPVWRRWQDAVRSNHADLRLLVVSARAGSSAIITDTWDADRYLHLALQQSGYHETRRNGQTEPCEKTAEEFTRGTDRILHLRLHQPFLQNFNELAAARLETWGKPCLERWKPHHIIWLAPAGQLQSPAFDGISAEVSAARARAARVIAEAHYSPQLPIEVSLSALDLLKRSYLRDEKNRESVRHSTSSELLDWAERRMAPRVWTSERIP